MGMPLRELSRRMSSVEFSQHMALDRLEQQAVADMTPPEELQWVG